MLRCAARCQDQSRNHSCLLPVRHIIHSLNDNVHKHDALCPQKTHQDTPLHTDPHAGRTRPDNLELQDKKVIEREEMEGTKMRDITK